jgi:hypothetical protein
MDSPLFGATLYPVMYIGHWCFPQVRMASATHNDWRWFT